ncbi:MAG TPA: hypothetical protein VIH86_12525 [Puia sp.]
MNLRIAGSETNAEHYSKDELEDKMFSKVMKRRPSPHGEGRQDEAE